MNRQMVHEPCQCHFWSLLPDGLLHVCQEMPQLPGETLYVEVIMVHPESLTGQQREWFNPPQPRLWLLPGSPWFEFYSQVAHKDCALCSHHPWTRPLLSWQSSHLSQQWKQGDIVNFGKKPISNAISFSSCMVVSWQAFLIWRAKHISKFSYLRKKCGKHELVHALCIFGNFLMVDNQPETRFAGSFTMRLLPAVQIPPLSCSMVAQMLPHWLGLMLPSFSTEPCTPPVSTASKLC